MIDCTISNRRFRVDPTGVYEELVEIPIAQLEPSELGPYDAQRIVWYAELYRRGSPFPPISVCGVTSRHSTYRICDGHHRWQAARLVSAPTLSAWTCFYVEYQRDFNGNTFPTLARISETPEGHRIARALGMTWCARCGSSLNMVVSGPICLSCQMAIEQNRGLAGQETAFARYVKEIHG